MIITSDFKDLVNQIFNKYNYCDIPITVGILIADHEQDVTRQYILNYLERFNQKSGKFIDFYLPGYYYNKTFSYSSKDYRENYFIKALDEKDKSIAFYDNAGVEYSFHRGVFNRFIEELEIDMKIKYTYNPMLILVEVSNDNKSLKYERKMVIDLAEMSTGVEK